MSRQSTDTVAIPHARGPNMLEVILTAMTREFQEDRSLCPRTYRAMRAVVESCVAGRQMAPDDFSHPASENAPDGHYWPSPWLGVAIGGDIARGVAHGGAVGGSNAADQVVNSEAKAAITHQLSAHQESSSLGPVHEK